MRLDYIFIALVGPNLNRIMPAAGHRLDLPTLPSLDTKRLSP